MNISRKFIRYFIYLSKDLNYFLFENILYDTILYYMYKILFY